MAENLQEDQVYCRDCGEAISERAEICPECGIRQQDPQVNTQSQSTENEKDSGLAAVASFLIPGLGQVYNGEIAKGIILGVVTFGLALTGIGLLLAVPIWIWLVYDAYQTAEDMGERSITSSETFELSTEESMKVNKALDWYAENASGAKLTESTKKRFNKSDSITDLSETQADRILNAIDGYQGEYGKDEALEHAREQFESRFEL